jgi:hypothetical protein
MISRLAWVNFALPSLFSIFGHPRDGRCAERLLRRPILLQLWGFARHV